MSSDVQKKPFLPRDKPKSWTIFIICVLISVLVAGPIVVLGLYLEIRLIELIGRYLFFTCWAIGVVMWCFYMYGLVTGRHRHLPERDWKDQIW